MSASKRVRWACPNGCAAVLASSRPRKDDVARYCLPCSAARGRLVLRAAPVLKAQREAKTAAAKTKKTLHAERSAKREAAYYEVHSVDLREELRKLWALPIARELRAKLHMSKRAPPVLVVKNRRAGTRRYGVCFGAQHKILINRIEGHDRHTVRDTLAHELAHTLTPGPEAHGVAWKTAYRLLCEQAYGVRPRVENSVIHETHTLMRAAAAGDAKKDT